MPRLALAAVLALWCGLFRPTSAQETRPHPVEIGRDPVRSDVQTDDALVGRSLAGTEDEAGLALEPAARRLLAESGGVDEDALRVRSAVETPAGTVFRVVQAVGGVPVWGSESVVVLDREGRVRSVGRGLRVDASEIDLSPRVTAETARTLVHGHLGAEGPFQFDEATLVVWPDPDGGRLAWRVRVVPAVPRGDWEGLVDAQTRSLLRVADRATYSEPPRLRRTGPVAETSSGSWPVVFVGPASGAAPASRLVSGTASVYVPDPLTRVRATYGQPGYSDDGDARSDELDDARVPVRLQVTEAGGLYRLAGPNAVLEDWDAPYRGAFERPSPDWTATRDDDTFEAASAYWHLDGALRYVRDTLGVAVGPTQYDGGVRFDPHGAGGRDESYYFPSTGRLAFGEGGVDDAEDADVVVHELGHALHHWLTGGTSLANADGLSEGFGDYFAVSYARRTGGVRRGTPEYDRVFRWDGHNEFWSGRTAAYAGTWPGPSGASVHERGQVFATALARIQDAVGSERTDRAALVGLSMTTGTATQPEAAQAVLDAAVGLGYPSGEVDVFYERFLASGYPVVRPALSRPAPSAGYWIGVPVPNPFRDRVRMDLVVERSQRVAVTAYDVLGRRVAELFSGSLEPHHSVPLIFDGVGLVSGVYVIQVQGETFSDAVRVTLVR